MARYANLGWDGLVRERNDFHNSFYAYPRVLARIGRLLLDTRRMSVLLAVLIGNVTYRFNHLRDREMFEQRPGAEPPRAAVPLPVVEAEIAGVHR